MQHAHQDEESAGHERRYHESVHAVLLDDAVHDDDEGAGGTADLHLAAAEERDEETGHDGREDAGFRRSARRDAESDGQRQGYDTYDNTCKQVLDKRFAVIPTTEGSEEFRLKTSLKVHKY